MGNSIDLTAVNDPCFAAIGGKTIQGCGLLTRINDDCGTYRCPFYKPKLCRAWIRIGNILIPPEEVQSRRKI